MTNCFKKHWFLIIGILLLSNYSFGQTFLSLTDTQKKPNGRPFIVRLNPTSTIAEQCTSQTITLDIGHLTYLPGSNGPLPVGIIITPVVNNGKTILTISGIVNDGKQGSSLLMDIAMQFKPGTCDDVQEEIIATTTNVGCNVISDQSGSVTVKSFTPDNVEVSMYMNKYVSEPICPGKVISYRINISNDGNQGFNISNAKLNIELDKCAQLVGVYKPYTYESVNPTITYVNGKQIVVVNTPNLALGPYTYVTSYDFYLMYPCLNGNENDCTSGPKDISLFLTGTKTDCGVEMITDKNTTTVQTTVSTSYCENVMCGTGGVGQLDSIYLYSSINLPCPTCAKNDPILAVVMNIPPLHPSYPDRLVIIDVPLEANIASASVNGLTPCGTEYSVVYIDAQGNRQSSPFPGSLNRKVEFRTNCAISSPITYFWFNLKYNEQTSSTQYLEFKVNFWSGGTKIFEGKTGSSVQSCIPSLSVYNQVRKVTETVYENNFNASAIPGELMTYRHELSNYGPGDTGNSVTIKLDDNLIYEGDFKYAYQLYNVNDADQFTSLYGKPNFEVPELGNVTVSAPVKGASGGTITLSGFNFPCTNNRLFVEFNVRPKSNVFAGNRLPVSTIVRGSGSPIVPQPNIITIAAFTYVKSKMFVKCSKANEWNDSGINVKNGEVVDFKMQFSNAGSTPVTLSELVNLRPQAGDLFEFGSNSRNSTLNINYNCDTPTVFTNASTIPSVNFKYALNSPTMSRDMLCPPQSSGNLPNWVSSCNNANWLSTEFLNNFTLMPGDYVDVIYKGKITGDTGTAYNSFAFKVDNCNITSANSNTLAILNDNIGIGCNSCTLTNIYSIEMKALFENLLKNVITRKINGETDAQINGSNPAELIALKPYISDGGGNKIYNFVSTVNAQNKITSIKFSFSSNSENDVTFLEEKGLDYNPEVGSVDPSYLRIDTTLFSSATDYLTTCRKTLDSNGNIISECNSKTQVRHVDFCPTRFCYPMAGEIKTGD